MPTLPDLMDIATSVLSAALSCWVVYYFGFGATTTSTLRMCIARCLSRRFPDVPSLPFVEIERVLTFLSPVLFAPPSATTSDSPQRSDRAGSQPTRPDRDSILHRFRRMYRLACRAAQHCRLLMMFRERGLLAVRRHAFPSSMTVLAVSVGLRRPARGPLVGLSWASCRPLVDLSQCCVLFGLCLFPLRHSIAFFAPYVM